jgi:protein-L-isoaspartate(D-aspartate) O-methyltransferase
MASTEDLARNMTSFDYAAARSHMIESQLRPNGVRDIPVLRAFATTPREIFIPQERRFLAYSDEAVEVAPQVGASRARYLMQPMILARILQHAALRPDDKVLVVGAATGYSAALIAKLGARVVAVEENGALLALARAALEEAGASGVDLVEGPLVEGAAGHQPFDVILLDGGTEIAPEGLFAQLKDGGRLFTVFGPERDAEATVFTKVKETVSRRALFDAGAKILPGFEAKPVFVF